MKNLSNSPIFSCVFRFMAICSLFAAMMCHYQDFSVCQAEEMPVFSKDNSSGQGRFEKTAKKRTPQIPPKEQEPASKPEAEPAVVIDDSNDDVIPLPPIEDTENAVIEEDTAKTETESTSVNDPADQQPAISGTPSDDVADDSENGDLEDTAWPGWLADYRKACQNGIDNKKMVLIYFYDTNTNSPYSVFESESLQNEEIQELLKNYICVRIPLTAKLPPTNDADEDRYVAMRPSVDRIDVTKLVAPGRDMGSVAQLKAEDFDLTFPELEEEITLIEHPAFYEMLNTPGIAIIDFKNTDAKYYGDVVSVFPFLHKKPYTIKQTKAMLTLPPGTVTQRSVIFAVRIHPDNPKSTEGELNVRLVEEARSHSQYQADIRKQGHHNWSSRFQKINIELPTELWASEVCAESWPGQHLLESAIECVACWRYSEGHWSAVVAEHPYYGYDMKLGTNGIWYGTGVFGKWRHATLQKAGTLSNRPQSVRL